MYACWGNSLLRDGYFFVHCFRCSGSALPSPFLSLLLHCISFALLFSFPLPQTGYFMTQVSVCQSCQAFSLSPFKLLLFFHLPVQCRFLWLLVLQPPLPFPQRTQATIIFPKQSILHRTVAVQQTEEVGL